MDEGDFPGMARIPAPDETGVADGVVGVTERADRLSHRKYARTFAKVVGHFHLAPEHDPFRPDIQPVSFLLGWRLRALLTRS